MTVIRLLCHVRLPVRIGWGFGLLLVLLGVVAAGGVVGLRSAETGFDHYAGISDESLRIERTRGDIAEMRRNVLIFANTGDQTAKVTGEGLIAAVGRQIAVEIGRDPKSTADLERMASLLGAYRGNLERVVTLRQQRDTLISDGMNVIGRQARETMTRILDTVMAAGATETALLVSRAQEALLLARLDSGRPVVHDGRTMGAVLLRISLQPLEVTWVDAAFRPDSEKPLVVDAQGTVILSAVPAWKARRMADLTRPVSVGSHGIALVRVPPVTGVADGPQAVHRRDLPRFGWQLLVLSPAQAVWRDARIAAWSAGAAVTCAALVLALVRQRRRVIAQKLATRAALQRANDDLEAKVRQRTFELEASNRELRREVQDRQHAEQVLRKAQEDLVQAGKLALLGQLSAGISHELGQPLTALRALADNGRLLLERGRQAQAADNFQAIGEVAERMGRITAQLKSFARKTSLDQARAVPLADAVDRVRELLSARLQAERVALTVQVPLNVQVHCVSHRLEQVLVNLLANAIDAVRGRERRDVEVRAAVVDERVRVRVSDSGAGIPPAAAQRLFEPFFTTKPPGEGLGLGLVISSHIVREFGGALRALPSAGGAVFEFDLAPADATPAEKESHA